MKNKPLTKLNKKNSTTSKWFEDYVMQANYDVIFIKLICSQFGVIKKVDFEWWSIILKVSLKEIFHLTKTKNRTKKSLISHTIAFSKSIIFCLRIPFPPQKTPNFNKLRESWHCKVYFLKLNLCACILTYQSPCV